MHLQAACTAAHCCGLAIRALVGAPAPHDFDDAAPRRVLAARRYYNQSRFGRRDPATQTLRSWDSMVKVAVLVAPQLGPHARAPQTAPEGLGLPSALGRRGPAGQTPPRGRVALQREAAQADNFAAFDHPGGRTPSGSSRGAPSSCRTRRPPRWWPARRRATSPRGAALCRSRPIWPGHAVSFPGPTGRDYGRSLHGAALGLLLTCSYLCRHLSEADLMADLAEVSAALLHALQ